MAQIFGTTDPYVAANGHKMVAPLAVSKHAPEDAEPFPIHAWAECTPDCPACQEGDNPLWYAGEEE